MKEILFIVILAFLVPILAWGDQVIIITQDSAQGPVIEICKAKDGFTFIECPKDKDKGD